MKGERDRERENARTSGDERRTREKKARECAGDDDNHGRTGIQKHKKAREKERERKRERNTHNA